MCSEGIGVLKSDYEVLRWYLCAAEYGHRKTQHNLGLMCCVGIGFPQDDEERFK
jgi:TPR repeat protein